MIKVMDHMLWPPVHEMLLLQHAVVFVNGDQYYGAKAGINVWTPKVTDEYEFSLSQIWVIAGSFGHDLNTIEAGWQACPYSILNTQFFSQKKITMKS